MALRKAFEAQAHEFAEGGRHARWRPLYEMVDHFLYASPAVTSSGPHVRDTINVQRITMSFVLATLPA